MKKLLEPQFEHDCEACQFLGRYMDYNASMGPTNYDLYQCGGKTVIARFGSDGPEYTSGLAFVESTLPLAVAYARALKAGVKFDKRFLNRRDMYEYY